MTGEEFYDLVEENTEDSGEGDNDSPLTLDRLAQLECCYISCTCWRRYCVGAKPV